MAKKENELSEKFIADHSRTTQQVWEDRGHVLERLTEIVHQCRRATANKE